MNQLLRHVTEQTAHAMRVAELEVKVIDDGGGMDVAGIRNVARARGIADTATLDAMSDAEIIDRMLQHPILMNRPIVVTPLGAVLSRPAETVLKILPSWRNSRD